MKNKRTVTVIISIFALIAVGTVALYVYEIANGASPTENLTRMLATVFICAAASMRMFRGGAGKRYTLDFYEMEFAKHIRGAFAHTPALRKKLLSAVRLYSESKYNQSMKKLIDLKPLCRTEDDIYAVGLFMGLNFKAARMYDAAVDVYRELIDLNITSSTVYGNLGNLYLLLGRDDDAISYMHLSIQNDENNSAPYNNLAQLYFEKKDFDKAKEYAHKALQIDSKMVASSKLLAIIYSLEGNDDEFKKYAHMSVVNGADSEDIRSAIKYYKSIREGQRFRQPEDTEELEEVEYAEETEDVEEIESADENENDTEEESDTE